MTLLCLAGATAACGAAKAQHVSLQVTPRAQLLDQPFTVTVRGLRPGQAASIGLRSTDAADVPWASAATFRADSHGEAAAGIGLLWSMQPTTRPGDEYYVWRGASPLAFTATVRVDGSTRASGTFTRRVVSSPVSARRATPASAGFAGELFMPAHRTSRAAVVLIAGSSGGLPADQAQVLAAFGYPALAVAYFNYPGLPPTLTRIPLEYFARALTWFSHQPGVDPAHILMMGISRGSEAALLLGVHYPRLVHGVIGMVPSNVAVCSFPGCKGPAWTLNGKPLPYVTRSESLAAQAAAEIPVERIQGPILLACGEDDQVWDSCDSSQSMISRLDAHHDRYAHLLYAYAGAGHEVGIFVPDQPANQSSDPTLAADEQARMQLWPHLLAFLAGV